MGRDFHGEAVAIGALAESASLVQRSLADRQVSRVSTQQPLRWVETPHAPLGQSASVLHVAGAQTEWGVGVRRALQHPLVPAAGRLGIGGVAGDDRRAMHVPVRLLHVPAA